MSDLHPGIVHQEQRFRRQLVFLWVGLLGLVGLSMLLGRYPRPYWLSPKQLWTDPLALQLVWALRLPRIVAALLLGASLAAGGLVLQMVFRNPLVEPGFLGVSQGAAFGAAFSILYLGGSVILIQVSATIFALCGLGFSYMLARHLHYGGWILRMILAGIAVSAFFAAGVGLLKYLADPLTQLPEITFWLLGGLWSTRWRNVMAVLPPTLLSLILLYLTRWRLNVLVLEENTAFSLGVWPNGERAGMIFLSVVATAAVVSLAGMIGWVGLIVPHMARRVFAPDARYALPASMVLGSMFTLVCDDLARTLTGGEIPLGIITSLLGALAFILLMTTQRVRARA